MSTAFPRTMVGGVSLSRMIVGTNWFLGYSHTSEAKDNFIKSYQTRKSVADTLEVFFKNGIDTVMGMPVPLLVDAVRDAQDRTGCQAKLILTPHFNIKPGGPAEARRSPAPVLGYSTRVPSTPGAAGG